MSGENKIGVEFFATTAPAVAEVGKLAAATRDQTTAAAAAGQEQQSLGKEIKATRAAQIEATEATRKAKDEQQLHTLTVAKFGAASKEAAASEARLTKATEEATRAATAAAASLDKTAKAATAAAAAEDGNLSPATKRAQAQVERMGQTAERTSVDLQKMALQSKGTGGGFDLMGLAGGKLMGVLGPAALGGTLIALAGWLGEASQKTLQYETQIGNLPFALGSAQTATRGLVLETELAAAASSAMALKVVKSEAEFARFASDAAKLAQKNSVATGQMLADLTTAVGRGSVEILDNAGIIVKAAEVNLAYASSIGKTVSELTDAEKKGALHAAMMAAISDAASKTTVAYDGNAAALARLKVSAGNAYDEMERGAVNAFGSIVVSVTSFDDVLFKMQDDLDRTNRSIMQAQNWSPAFKSLAGDAGSAALEFFNLSEAAANLSSADTLAQVTAAVDAERQKATILTEEAKQAERIAKAMSKVAADNEAFLQAQTEASLFIGPMPAPKAEKKKTAAAKPKDIRSSGDVALARVFDGADVSEGVAADAFWNQVEIEQAAADRSYEIKQQGLAQEMEILEARGAAGEEAQLAREALIDRQLEAEREFAQQQKAMAKTDATREAAQTRMEANEYQRRLVALRRMAAAEEAEHARKVAITEKVTARVGDLGTAMVEAAWQAAEGQRGAGLQALGDYLKTVSKQMAVKALVETALGVSALAGIVTAGLAPGHFAAAGMAAAVAIAAGGAGIGLSAAGDARAAEGGRAESSGAANGPGVAGAVNQTGGEREKRELSAQEVPISYGAGGGAANMGGNVTNVIDLSGSTFIGGASAEGAAQAIEKILRQGKAAGKR
jgi:hypothetical protein